MIVCDWLLIVFLFKRIDFHWSLNELCPENGLISRNIYISRDKSGLPMAYLVPKRRVDRLSEASEGLGEQQHNKTVREFPPCCQRKILGVTKDSTRERSNAFLTSVS